MKLISMTEYVLGISSNEIEPKNFAQITEARQYQNDGYDKMINYANFLKRPLELEMFRPTDKEGNVLEEPKEPKNELGNSLSWIGYNKQLEQYQEALDRVLFEGFEIGFTSEHSVIIRNTKTFVEFRFGKTNIAIKEIGGNKELKTIEDLVEFDLTLTESEKKLIQ